MQRFWKHVLASQKQSAPWKWRKHIFSTEHFIFILFPEINLFSLLQNMCLRHKNKVLLENGASTYFLRSNFFILFLEINFFSLLQNMCLRRFKQGEEIYHHPSSAFGFATAFLTGAGAALLVVVFPDVVELVKFSSNPTRENTRQAIFQSPFTLIRLNKSMYLKSGNLNSTVAIAEVPA